jgi:hypothetical protein
MLVDLCKQDTDVIRQIWPIKSSQGFACLTGRSSLRSWHESVQILTNYGFNLILECTVVKMALFHFQVTSVSFYRLYRNQYRIAAVVGDRNPVTHSISTQIAMQTTVDQWCCIGLSMLLGPCGRGWSKDSMRSYNQQKAYLNGAQNTRRQRGNEDYRKVSNTGRLLESATINAFLYRQKHFTYWSDFWSEQSKVTLIQLMICNDEALMDDLLGYRYPASENSTQRLHWAELTINQNIFWPRKHAINPNSRHKYGSRKGRKSPSLSGCRMRGWMFIETKFSLTYLKIYYRSCLGQYAVSCSRVALYARGGLICAQQWPLLVLLGIERWDKYY